MGTSTSARQFSGKITKMATATQTRQKQIVAEAALVVKELIYAEAAADGIGPSSKIARGKWGARYDIKGFGTPTALVRVYGPFHLVERDTKPHPIGPRGARRGRRRGRMGMRFPDGGIRNQPVQHPGTRGKGSFGRARTRAHVVVPRIMQKSLVSGWRQALR